MSKSESTIVEKCKQLVSLGEAIHRSVTSPGRKVSRKAFRRDSKHLSRVDAQFLHARDQCRALDVHARCGTVGACHTPACDFQDAEDLIAFIGLPRARDRRGPAVVAQFSDRSLQCRAGSKDHRPLDEVLHLTNVSPPIPPRNLPHAPTANRSTPFLPTP